MKNFATVAALVAGLTSLSAAGVANARVTQVLETTIENTPESLTSFLSLTLAITTPTGDTIPGSSFDELGPAGAFIGGPGSLTPRGLSAVIFTDEVGQPGDQLLRFEFPQADLWAPGQTLTFRFSVDVPDSYSGPVVVEWQFEPAPSPGSLALAGLGLLIAFPRRRAR